MDLSDAERYEQSRQLLHILISYGDASTGDCRAGDICNFAGEENRLVTDYVGGSWKSEFVYDGFSQRRIQRDYAWSNGGWTKTNEMRLIYDGNVIIQHRDANNLPTLALTRGLDLSGSLQKAGGIGGLLAMTENPGTSPTHSYYHSDGIGNVTALISPNQMVVAKAIYDPYGGFISLNGPKASVNPYWFSSKPMHAASGKYDFLYRWYAPNLQRWINRDPLANGEIIIGLRLPRGFKNGPWEGVGGPNTYLFVLNDPILCIDANGLWTLTIGYSFTAGLGLGFTVGFNFGIDGEGHIGADFGVGGGGYLGAGFSSTAVVRASNAKCLKETLGKGWQIGASGGEALVGGGGAWGGDGYNGLYGELGVGGGTPVSGVGMLGYSWGGGSYDP